MGRTLWVVLIVLFAVIAGLSAFVAVRMPKNKSLLVATHSAINNLPDSKVYPKSSLPPPSKEVVSSQHFKSEIAQTSFIPLEPNHYYFDLGQTYLNHKNYQLAIESFNKALETEPETSRRAEILYFLGYVYQFNSLPKAKEAAQNSVKLYEAIIDKLPITQKEPVQIKMAALYYLLDQAQTAEQIAHKILNETTSEEIKAQANDILFVIEAKRSDKNKTQGAK